MEGGAGSEFHRISTVWGQGELALGGAGWKIPGINGLRWGQGELAPGGGRGGLLAEFVAFEADGGGAAFFVAVDAGFHGAGEVEVDVAVAGGARGFGVDGVGEDDHVGEAEDAFGGELDGFLIEVADAAILGFGEAGGGARAGVALGAGVLEGRVLAVVEVGGEGGC